MTPSMNFFSPAATDARGDSVNLTFRRMKGLKRWEGLIRLAASGGGSGVGRVTSECFLACGFCHRIRDSGLPRLPIFRGPSNCSGITCPFGFLRQNKRLRDRGSSYGDR